MKKIILLLTFVCIWADETSQILALIKNLESKNYIYTPIKTLYNPFISTTTIKKANVKSLLSNITSAKVKQYNLQVIFQNKVKINNQWYKNGDTIDNYKIIIKNNSVYLKSKSKLIKFKTKNIIKVQ